MSTSDEQSNSSANNPAQQKLRRIAVLGSRAVGKSSLTIQFVENHFVDSYYPTIENTFTKVFKYRGQEFTVEIIDTAGQDEYSILGSQHAIGIHGYALVYSVTSKSSYELIKIIREKILNFSGTDWVPMVLVGNKKDLQNQRQVTTEEVKELAQQWNCQWVETSAKTNENIGKLFEGMIEEIERSINPAKGERGECIVL